MDIEKLRFPVGKFIKPDIITPDILESWIKELETLPKKLRQETENLSEEQLNTPYREGGWTIRQVVHHIADSHMNTFIRVKLTLTEEKPIIKPYFEERWAELVDSKLAPVESSLQIIEGIHQRWILIFKSLSKKDQNKVFIHPEHGREFTLNEILGTYSWHGNHHLAHITTLKKSKNW